MGQQQSTPAPSARTASPSARSEREKQVQAFAGLSIAGEADEGAGRRKTPTSGSASITVDDVASWRSNYAAVPSRQVLETLLSKQDILAGLTTRRAEIANIHVFNHKLSFDVTPISNQKQSGRCWLFAALNMARIAFCKKYNVSEFQFSQSYPFFWDHIEKSNVFLENIIDLAEDKLDSRIMDQLMSDPVGDGGEWAFAVNLFERYGVLPQPLYPESYSSSNSAKMDRLIDSKLRDHAVELRKLYSDSKANVLAATNKSEYEAARAAVSICRTKKGEQLGEIYTILSLCLGTPPCANDKFKYEFYDKAGKYQCIQMTPLEMYKSLAPGFNPSQSFSVVNEPNHELGKLYGVDRFQNVQGGAECLYVNTEIKDLEQAVIAMIKADVPVWFACDAGGPGSRPEGIWDVEVCDLQGAFGTKSRLDKAQRLATGDSSPTHAMMIQGVHVEDGKPVRYMIQNSWGADVGSKGYFVCTADWFREYVYEVVVPRSMAPSRLVKILDAGNPVMLPPWGTMVKKPYKGML